MRRVERGVVELEEVGDLGDPALCDEADVRRMLVVTVVRALVCELHRDAEAELVFRADLAQQLERLDTVDRGELLCGREEGRLLGRSGRMSQTESDGMTDAAGVH